MEGRKKKKAKGLECLYRGEIVCHKGRKLDEIIEVNEYEDKNIRESEKKKKTLKHKILPKQDHLSQGKETKRDYGI